MSRSCDCHCLFCDSIQDMAKEEERGTTCPSSQAVWRWWWTRSRTWPSGLSSVIYSSSISGWLRGGAHIVDPLPFVQWCIQAFRSYLNFVFG